MSCYSLLFCCAFFCIIFLLTRVIPNKSLRIMGKGMCLTTNISHSFSHDNIFAPDRPLSIFTEPILHPHKSPNFTILRIPATVHVLGTGAPKFRSFLPDFGEVRTRAPRQEHAMGVRPWESSALVPFTQHRRLVCAFLTDIAPQTNWIVCGSLFGSSGDMWRPERPRCPHVHVYPISDTHIRPEPPQTFRCAPRFRGLEKIRFHDVEPKRRTVASTSSMVFDPATYLVATPRFRQFYDILLQMIPHNVTPKSKSLHGRYTTYIFWFSDA